MGPPLPGPPPARLPAVFRDPAVEADDHEREEGFVELALASPGRIAQVDPDRVGLAVAVVVHVVGDLAGGAGDRSGNAAASWPSAARAEDPRGRVVPQAGVVGRPSRNSHSAEVDTDRPPGGGTTG